MERDTQSEAVIELLEGWEGADLETAERAASVLEVIGGDAPAEIARLARLPGSAGLRRWIRMQGLAFGAIAELSHTCQRAESRGDAAAAAAARDLGRRFVAVGTQLARATSRPLTRRTKR